MEKAPYQRTMEAGCQEADEAESDRPSRLKKPLERPPRMEQPFVIGVTQTARGAVPLVATALSATDLYGTVLARLGIGRMNYMVDPGLYAVGAPKSESPVLVTANYKMSFDALRSALRNIDAWLLVLDTKGINVWCAAGKGLFGTDELVSRIETSGLAALTSHRTLTVPQLGAPGIAAHEVKRRSGFRVVYGPVRTQEIPRFLIAGMKADSLMRRKTFTFWERAELIPVEFLSALRAAAIIVPVLSIFGALVGDGPFFSGLRLHGEALCVIAGIALTAGCFLTPLLLFHLPGRTFSGKAILPFTALFTVWVCWGGAMGVLYGIPVMELLGSAMMGLAVASHLSMIFTGSSTFTSLSAVRREMRTALPCQIVCAAAGFWVWLGSFWLPGGVCGP